MEILNLVMVAMIGLVSVILVYLILRRFFKKKAYRFEMIFMTPGIDDHHTVYDDELSFEHEVGNKTYDIKAERLYRLKPGFLGKLGDKIVGVKERFIVVYQHNETEPIAPGEIAVSARILKEVGESSALDNALRSEFNVPWDLKKILMIIGFLVIAVIVWFLISGDVTL